MTPRRIGNRAHRVQPSGLPEREHFAPGPTSYPVTGRRSRARTLFWVPPMSYGAHPVTALERFRDTLIAKTEFRIFGLG